ncbi:MAG: hypothetical protein WA997_08635 [Anaerolineales bacterium]|nr:hypothetical protein [Anaerolineales bacterium]
MNTKAIYDVEVDTSDLSPQECVAIIIEYTRAVQLSLAFAQIREKHLRDFQ